MQPDSLAEIFRRLIRTTGPISLTQYMGESNARYYAGRDPLGSAGDFVTAPEISQMFGELLGLWLADIWHRAGRPEGAIYVEPGPGRGTLAKDALRAMRSAGLEPRVHLVEGSPALRTVQRAVLGEGVTFHDDLSTIPDDGPLLLLANEFLDALPVRQLVKTAQGWHEVMVGLDGNAFAPVAGPRPMDAAVPEHWRDAEEGTLLETCPGAASAVREIAQRLANQGGAALLVDYGHTGPRTGSTLQAVRAHAKVDPFATPGECDLTAHVDFHQMRMAAQDCGARWLGTAGQGAFLVSMGIDQRMDMLAQSAPQKAGELALARDRLVDARQMGTLFKVMGLAGPDWPDGAALALPHAG